MSPAPRFPPREEGVTSAAQRLIAGLQRAACPGNSNRRAFGPQNQATSGHT